MSPIKIENVIGYYFVPSDNDEFDVFLKKIIPMNIETLSINLGEALQDWDKPWNFDWILSFKNLKKLTIIGESIHDDDDSAELDVDLSYMFDVLKKIDGMKMIEFDNCDLKKEFVDQFLSNFGVLLTEMCYSLGFYGMRKV